MEVVVYAVYAFYAVYTVQTALHCLNSSMYAYIFWKEGQNAIGWVVELLSKMLCDWMGDTPKTVITIEALRC